MVARAGCGRACSGPPASWYHHPALLPLPCRLSFIHCDARTCPCGDRCSNRPFVALPPPDMEVFLTANKGWGVRARSRIPRGTFVVEYAGGRAGASVQGLRAEGRAGVWAGEVQRDAVSCMGCAGSKGRFSMAGFCALVLCA